MKITRLERTVVSVPFLPGILPSFEYQEFTSSYPEPLSHRNQDIVRIYTDAGLIGLGMSGPYYGELEDRPPDLIGKNPLHFEPRNLGGGGYQMALLDLIGQVIGWPLCRIFGGRLQDRILVDYWIARMNPEDSAAAARPNKGSMGSRLSAAWKTAMWPNAYTPCTRPRLACASSWIQAIIFTPWSRP